MPDSTVFAHNVKPTAQIHPNIETNKYFNLNKKDTKFKPNLSKNKLVKKHYKNNFYKRYDRISKIGNKPVVYKGNRIHTIGGHKVLYGPYGKIKQIGSLPVLYQNNQIQQVGTMPVIYGNNNEIIRIGNWSVSYDG